MAMRSVAAASWSQTGNRLAGSARPFSDSKGKVLSEEELATAEKNKLFTQKLQTGDMFVFPKGLVQYQRNPDAKMNAVSVADFGSTNAGTVFISSSVFTTGINVNVLAKAFDTDVLVVQKIEAGLAHKT